MGLPSLDLSSAARHKLWYGDQLGNADAQVVATGCAALDAQLPGGGWPVGALVEVLQSSPEAQVWQLLLPALAQAVATRGGPVALVGAPFEPFGPALAAGGLPLEALLWIKSEGSQGRAIPQRQQQRQRAASGVAAMLWACEQALRCRDVAAVLAWLPQVRVGELRRLQLAAAQHEALLFVFRPESAADSASPARLRLSLATRVDSSGSSAQMEVHLLKRRGPPLAAPLNLPARSNRMTALLAAGQQRRKARRHEQGGALVGTLAGTRPGILTDTLTDTLDSALPDFAQSATVDIHLALPKEPKEKLHALDRIALAG